MGKINILGFDVANMIAAGEVVDRPSSVVKELLENALDAGGTSITVEIRRGGIAYIRVTDNGCGMDTDDLPTALLRHATSKIKTADDLTDITTLGFRGEALAAISSVSRIRIYSKIRENSFGALLEADGGEIVGITETGCADGTTVIVEDLFFNVPARRKFLKKDSTEAIAAGTVIEKIALSRPDVSIKFISDGEIKFMTAGNGRLGETLFALFGRETAKRMIPIDRYDEESAIRVSGFISAPDMQRSNRNMQNFFINGRFVKSKTASAALEQAYTSRIPVDKFPSCVMNLTINPAAVDVNVHPAKLEVKFANEKLVFDAVYYAVLSALDAEASRPELKVGKVEGMPVSQSKYASSANPANAAMQRITKSSGVTANEIKNAFVPMDGTESHSRAAQKTAQIELSTNHSNTINAADNPGTVKSKNPASGMTYNEMLRLHREAIDKANAELDISSVQEKTTVPPKPAQQMQKSQPETQLETQQESQQESDKKGSASSGEPAKSSVSETHAARTAPDNAPSFDEFDPSDIPEYIILGEAFNCYILVQLSDRILVIDKHAAHERILFDELCRKMRSSQKNTQLLVAPIEITVSNNEADAISNYGAEIRSVGFEFNVSKESVAQGKVSVTEIPDFLSTDEAYELFSTLISKLTDAITTPQAAAAEFFESRLWQAACKAAIKGGRIYDTAHLRWICDRLLQKPDGNRSPIRTCPHGRPVAFDIMKSSIERQFERT